MSRKPKPKGSLVGKKILEAMDEAVSFARGHKTEGEFSVIAVQDAIDVESLRNALGMTREEFADAYGFTYKTLENYERERRKTNRQVRYYLRAIQNDPVGVFNAIHGTHLNS